MSTKTATKSPAKSAQAAAKRGSGAVPTQSPAWDSSAFSAEVRDVLAPLDREVDAADSAARSARQARFLPLGQAIARLKSVGAIKTRDEAVAYLNEVRGKDAKPYTSATLKRPYAIASRMLKDGVAVNLAAPDKRAVAIAEDEIAKDNDSIDRTNQRTKGKGKTAARETKVTAATYADAAALVNALREAYPNLTGTAAQLKTLHAAVDALADDTADLKPRKANTSGGRA